MAIQDEKRESVQTARCAAVALALACAGLMSLPAQARFEAEKAETADEAEGTAGEEAPTGAPATESEEAGGWTREAQSCFEAVSSPTKGILTCTEAIEAGGLDVESLSITYSNRGNSFFELGKFQRAVDDYDIALALTPEDDVTLSNRGAAYTDLGEFDKAIADFDAAIALDRTNPTAWANRCWANTLRKEYLKALSDCNRALTFRPSDPVTLAIRASVRMAREDLDGALEDADEAVRLGPKIWKTHFYRGLVHHARGDKEKALDDLARAYELGPDQADVVTKMEELGFAVPVDPDQVIPADEVDTEDEE